MSEAPKEAASAPPQKEGGIRAIAKNIFKKAPWLKWILLAIAAILLRYLIMDGLIPLGQWTYHTIVQQQETKQLEEAEKADEPEEAKPLPF